MTMKRLMVGVVASTLASGVMAQDTMEEWAQANELCAARVMEGTYNHPNFWYALCMTEEGQWQGALPFMEDGSWPSGMAEEEEHLTSLERQLYRAQETTEGVPETEGGVRVAEGMPEEESRATDLSLEERFARLLAAPMIHYIYGDDWDQYERARSFCDMKVLREIPNAAPQATLAESQAAQAVVESERYSARQACMQEAGWFNE